MKLNREDVDDRGPFSMELYEAARRRLILGEFLDERIMSECVYVFVRSSVGGICSIVAPQVKRRIYVS